jgi:hypothetical protein
MTRLLIAALLFALATPAHKPTPAPTPKPLGCFGADRGAASMDWNAQARWAQGNSFDAIRHEVLRKTRVVFTCRAVTSANAINAYADLSALIAQYVPDQACLGDPMGPASTDWHVHYRWGLHHSRKQMLAELDRKTGLALTCVSGTKINDLYADLSVTLAQYGR